MQKPYWYRLFALALAPALVWAWLRLPPVERWWLECFTAVFAATLICGTIAERRAYNFAPDDPWPEFVSIVGRFLATSLGAAWATTHTYKIGYAAICALTALHVSFAASALREKMKDPDRRGPCIDKETIRQGVAIMVVGLFLASVISPASGWATLPLAIALASGIIYIHWDRSHRTDPGIEFCLVCVLLVGGFGAYSAWPHLSKLFAVCFGGGCVAAFAFALICHDKIWIAEENEKRMAENAPETAAATAAK